MANNRIKIQGKISILIQDKNQYNVIYAKIYNAQNKISNMTLFLLKSIIHGERYAQI